MWWWNRSPKLLGSERSNSLRSRQSAARRLVRRRSGYSTQDLVRSIGIDQPEARCDPFDAMLSGQRFEVSIELLYAAVEASAIVALGIQLDPDAPKRLSVLRRNIAEAVRLLAESKTG